MTIQDTNHYVMQGGTHFKKGTPDEVMGILNKAIASNRGVRIRIFYADAKGQDMLYTKEVIGYIIRDYKEIRQPLLAATATQYGGTPIFSHAIKKITIDKKVVYKHPKYIEPTFIVKKAPTGQGWVTVLNNGSGNRPVAKSPTEQQATNVGLYFQGVRNKM